METTEQVILAVMAETAKKPRKVEKTFDRPFVANLNKYPLANLSRKERKALNAIRAMQEAIELDFIRLFNPSAPMESLVSQYAGGKKHVERKAFDGPAKVKMLQTLSRQELADCIAAEIPILDCCILASDLQTMRENNIGIVDFIHGDF